MYYYYQSKSVIDLDLMFYLESDNYVVAVSIFGFSVLVPFIKLTLSILLLLSRSFRDNNLVKKVVGRIGKVVHGRCLCRCNISFLLIIFKYEFRNRHRGKYISGALLLFSLLYPVNSIFTNY